MAGEWLAQLPEDLRTNEAFTGHETLGDFANAHLITAGKVSEFDGKAVEYEGKIADLESRFANTIPRLTEDSTDEETAAFNKALGVPDTADGYDFPKTEGIEQDENMLTWARDTFHQLGIPADKAAGLSQAWDVYMSGINKAYADSIAEGVTTATESLKDEWKADYDKNIAETQRGYQAFEKAAPGFSEAMEMETSGGIKLGNHPAILKAFHSIYKAIGDDSSFNSPPGGHNGEKPEGMLSIYKVPNPPREE